MRLALAQTNPTIGDMAGNAALVGRAIERAKAAGAGLVVLPELCISGYPPKDLLLAEGFVASAVKAADEVGRGATGGGAGITAIFGVPAPLTGGSGRTVANALFVYRGGRRVGEYHKRLLPTYDVFDEDRYFEPGSAPMVIDVGGVRVGLSICEDLWKGEDAGFASRYLDAPDPVAELSAAGVDVIVSPSASPFVMGKGAKHAEILRRHAKQRGVFVASVNQLGGNDDLIFDGHGAVYGPDGELVAASARFVEDVLVVEVGKGGRAKAAGADPLAAMPAEEQVFRALVLGTRDYLRKTGFADALIGLSGGIDSAVTAVIAASALGPGHVTGVVMPSRYSSEHSKTDAYELARRLGVRCITLPIEGPFTGFGKALDAAFTELGRARLGATMPDITEENLQSRIRGTILMGLSNRTGAMVLTTGNKSELAVGYSTLYGDMNGGLAVLSDVSKQLVYRLARWMNANAGACGFRADRPPIPEGSITKPPSAELRPNQTDQDSLPPYDVLDEIIERYVEKKESGGRIIKETGFDAAVVAKVVRMIDVAEYKRKQLATGLKVTTVAFGTGRRVPIAQGWRG